MKRIELTTEWLAKWSPKRREEVTDRICRGLVVRGGPSGAKVFYRWTDAQDPATGRVRRQRVKLGRWAIESGKGAVSLGDARAAFLTAQETKRADVDGTAELTIADVANAYRRDVLSHRERADEAWEIVRVHVVEAQPDAKRPPFGEWPARAVRPADVAAVVRYAKEPRTVPAKTRAGRDTVRRLGGPGVGRVVLRELKSIFANAVGAGDLEMSPAAVVRAQSLGLRASKRERVLDAEEVKEFFGVLDLTALLGGTAKPRRLSPTVRLALAFLLYTPVRSHSLIGARWEEVDFDAATWTVPVARQKLHKDRRAVARPFVVPLAPTAVAILRKLREEAGDGPWVLASPLEPKQHVEEKALVRALSRLQTTRDEERAPRLAFGARFTVHDLRRTWRAWAGNHGIDFETAEKSLGHALPGVADVYARGDYLDRRAQATELVGAALDRARLGEAATVVPIASARGA